MRRSFASGAAYSPDMSWATSPTGTPYYLQKPEEPPAQFVPDWSQGTVAPPPPPPPLILPDGTPYYLANPENPLPSWVIPAVVGGGALLLVGTLTGVIVFGKKRKKRR